MDAEFHHKSSLKDQDPTQQTTIYENETLEHLFINQMSPHTLKSSQHHLKAKLSHLLNAMDQHIQPHIKTHLKAYSLSLLDLKRKLLTIQTLLTF